MDKTVIQWRVYCETEHINVYGLLFESQGSPSGCFNDPLHVINPSSLSETDKFSNNQVTIKEEEIPTGGNFKADSYKMICPPGVSDHEYSFPFPVTVLMIIFHTTIEHSQHTIDILAGRDTTIGFISQPALIGENSIICSSTALQYIKLGFYLKLANDTITNELGRVIAVNKSLNTVWFETPLIDNFTVSPITFVKMTVKPVDNFKIGHPGQYDIGAGKIGGSYLPANSKINIIYNNPSEVTTILYPMIEYLY